MWRIILKHNWWTYSKLKTELRSSSSITQKFNNEKRIKIGSIWITPIDILDHITHVTIRLMKLRQISCQSVVVPISLIASAGIELVHEMLDQAPQYRRLLDVKASIEE